MAAPAPATLSSFTLPEVEEELSQVLGYSDNRETLPAKHPGMLTLPWHPSNDVQFTGPGPRISMKVPPAYIGPLQRVDSAWDETLHLAPSSPMAAAQPTKNSPSPNPALVTNAQNAAFPNTNQTAPSPQADQHAPILQGSQEMPGNMLSVLSSLRIPQQPSCQDPQAPHQPATPPKHAIHPPPGHPRPSASSKLIRLRTPTAQGSTSLDAILSQTASANAHALSFRKQQSSQDHSAGVSAANSWLQNAASQPTSNGPVRPTRRSPMPIAIHSLSQVLPPGRHSPTHQHLWSQQQPVHVPSPRVSASDAISNNTAVVKISVTPAGHMQQDSLQPGIAYPRHHAQFLSSNAPSVQPSHHIMTSPVRLQLLSNQGQARDLKASFAFDVVALHAKQPQSPAPASSPIRRPYSPYILNDAKIPHRSQRSPDKWATRVLPGSYSPVPPVIKAATVLPARRSCSSGRRYSPSLTIPRDGSAGGQSPPRRSGMSHARSKLLDLFCPSSPRPGSQALGKEVTLLTPPSMHPQQQQGLVSALRHGTVVLVEDLKTVVKPSNPAHNLSSSLLHEVLAAKDRRAVSDSGCSSSSSIGMILIKDGQLIQMPMWERPRDSQIITPHHHVVQAPWRPVPAPLYATSTSPPRVQSPKSPPRASPRTALFRGLARAPAGTEVIQPDNTSDSVMLGNAPAVQITQNPSVGSKAAVVQASFAESAVSQDSSSASSVDEQEQAESAGASALLGYLELKFTHTVKRRQLGRILQAWRARTVSKSLRSSSAPTSAVAAATAALTNTGHSQEAGPPPLEPRPRASSRSTGAVDNGMTPQTDSNFHESTMQTGLGSGYPSGNLVDSSNHADTYAGLYARLTQASARSSEHTLVGVAPDQQQPHQQQQQQQRSRHHTSSAVRQLTFHGSSSNSSSGRDQEDRGAVISGDNNQRLDSNCAAQLNSNAIKVGAPKWRYSREGEQEGRVGTDAHGVVGGSSAIFQDLHAMIFDMEALLQRSGGSLYPINNANVVSTNQQPTQQSGMSQEHLNQGPGNERGGSAFVMEQPNGSDHSMFGYSNSAGNAGGAQQHPAQQYSSQQADFNQSPLGSGHINVSGSLSGSPSKLWIQPQRVTALQYDKSLYASAAAHASSNLITASAPEHTHDLPVERAATTQWPPRNPNRSDPGIAVEAVPAQLQRGSSGTIRTPAPPYTQPPPSATRGWSQGTDVQRNQYQPPPQRPPITTPPVQASSITDVRGGYSYDAWRSNGPYPSQPIIYSDPGSVHDNPLLERIQRITASCLPVPPRPASPSRGLSTMQQIYERQHSAGSFDGTPPPPGRELSLAFPTSQTPVQSNTLAALRQTQDAEDGSHSNSSTRQSWFDYTAVAAAAAAAAPTASQFYPPPAVSLSANQFFPVQSTPSQVHTAPTKLNSEPVNEAALLQELTQLEKALHSIGGGVEVNAPNPLRYFT